VVPDAEEMICRKNICLLFFFFFFYLWSYDELCERVERSSTRRSRFARLLDMS